MIVNCKSSNGRRREPNSSHMQVVIALPPVDNVDRLGEPVCGDMRQCANVTGGLHSQFNCSLCMPALRWLSHAPISPIVVTLTGLLVVFLAELCV